MGRERYEGMERERKGRERGRGGMEGEEGEGWRERKGRERGRGGMEEEVASEGGMERRREGGREGGDTSSHIVFLPVFLPFLLYSLKWLETAMTPSLVPAAWIPTNHVKCTTPLAPPCGCGLTFAPPATELVTDAGNQYEYDDYQDSGCSPYHRVEPRLSHNTLTLSLLLPF
jgi:hypothetical protein